MLAVAGSDSEAEEKERKRMRKLGEHMQGTGQGHRGKARPSHLAYTLSYREYATSKASKALTGLLSDTRSTSLNDSANGQIKAESKNAYCS